MKSAIPTLLIFACTLVATEPAKELTPEQKIELLQARLSYAAVLIDVNEKKAAQDQRLTAASTTFSMIRSGLLLAIGAPVDGSCDLDPAGKLTCKKSEPKPEGAKE